MDYRVTALILISVILNWIAFICPMFFYWTMLICFIPLFCILPSVTFSRLFYLVFWALLLMTLQWWPLITIIVKQGNHPLKYCIPVICLLLVAAGALVVGGLNVLVNAYIRFLYARVVLHAMVWWLFIEWMHRYMFITFGYTLSYPLLPLTMQPVLLKVGVYVPMAFLMFCLLLAQMAAASYYCYGNKGLLMVAVFSYASFFIGLLVPTNKRAISMNVKYGIAPGHRGTMLDEAQEIAKCIIDARGYDYLIFPESSFCYDCLSDPAIIQLWREYIDENQTIIIGTHVKRADQWRVTACCLTQQEICWHDKSFLLPLAECVPAWAPICCEKIFLHNHEAFYPAHTSAEDDPYDLLICAELFLSKDCWRQMATGSGPIMVLVSDSWCNDTWLPNLMLLFSRFKAIEWGRVMIYSSSTRFCVID